jgi:glycosyltransferase involved in cell wall biosynthesis
VKVALVTTLGSGGPIEHSVVLARGLRAAGVEVDVVCGTPKVAQRFADADARPLVLPLRHQLDASNAVRIRRALGGADVVHAQDRRSGLWTRVLPGTRGAIRVYTIHGLPDPYLPPPAGSVRPGVAARVAYEGIDRALARRAHALITPSQAFAELLTRRLGIPRARLHVVPNGVELQPPVAGGEEVGTLSSLEPVKAVDVFVEAASRLSHARPGLRFVVFGTGSQGEALRRRVRELGLGDRLAFAGEVPSREALRRLAVLAVPSLIENAPLGLLEAMAAGVPVVASEVGGVPEIATADTAQLVAPRDPGALARAIARLLDDPELAGGQAERARARVEADFGAGRMTERTLGLYRDLQAMRS